MGTDSQWQALKTALRREIEAIFAASGEIILIESLNESGSEMMLSNRTASLKLKDVPERDAVRWETDTEYSLPDFRANRSTRKNSHKAPPSPLKSTESSMNWTGGAVRLASSCQVH